MSIGTLLKRAEMLSTTSDGKPLRRVHRHAIGETIMPVKETPRHALSQANTEATEEQEENARKERAARSKFLDLSDLDREVLRLHLWRGKNQVERKQLALPSMRAGMEKVDWYFVRHTRDGRCEMVRSEPEQLDHRQIGERVGLSVSSVRRHLNSIDPSLVDYAQRLGWV